MTAYRHIYIIQPKRGSREVSAKGWSYDERDGENERCEQIQQSLVDFLPDKKLGTEFPPS